MSTKLKSYASRLARATAQRLASHRLTRRKDQRRAPMECLDLELFQVDIRM
ncbi:hypothetical protein [Azospirillum sp. sgz302134]